MLIVPFTSDYDQTFRTQIGGETYVFDARWNERGQHWTFDLTRNSDQVLLVAGVPLLAGQDVLSPYALGIGGLVVADLGNTNSDPGPDDLGDRAIVVFFSPEELDLLAGAGVPGISTGAPPPPAGTSFGGGGGTSTGGSGGTTTVTTVINQSITNLTLVGGGFSSDQQQSDSVNTETLVYRFPVNAGLNPNATLKAIAALITEGTGTIRMYLDTASGTIGDTGTPSGTLVGSASVPGTKFISGTPFANPGGMVYVKITVQAAPSATVQVDVVNGAAG